MSGVVALACAFVACACAAVAAALVALRLVERHDRARRRKTALGASASGRRLAGAGLNGVGLRYATSLTRGMYVGTTVPLSPSVRARRAGQTRAGKRFKEQAVLAGCGKDVSVSGYLEACTRLSAACALAGALFGALLSTELAIVLGVAGAIAGRMLPERALAAARRERAAIAERHLSEMLEVLALGLRSGLSFDASFALYGSHFDGEFARSCTRAYRSWSLGLVTREQALREFADSYDCDQLGRVVDSVVRSLRFGSALTDILEEAAVQSRASYRTALEERVAKAPVKMMLPTGTLILPAMLLLVMGPILLELAGGF